MLEITMSKYFFASSMLITESLAMSLINCALGVWLVGVFEVSVMFSSLQVWFTNMWVQIPYPNSNANLLFASLIALLGGVNGKMKVYR